MVSHISFSIVSNEKLQQRQLSNVEISDFQSLLNEARKDMYSQELTAKETLQSMSADELSLIQKANCLAHSIKVDELSNEGAINLLQQPDGSEYVDLNNDGLVEVGEGKRIIYPPVNAPEFVKEAWDQATASMNEADKMFMELHMHTAMYGVHIDGMPTQPIISQDEQWSEQGIDELFARLRDGLEFQMRHSGWSDNLEMQRRFYNRFEEVLG